MNMHCDQIAEILPWYLNGTLDGAQLARLREAAETCRISRALSIPVSLRLTLA